MQNGSQNSCSNTTNVGLKAGRCHVTISEPWQFATQNGALRAGRAACAISGSAVSLASLLPPLSFRPSGRLCLPGCVQPPRNCYTVKDLVTGTRILTKQCRSRALSSCMPVPSRQAFLVSSCVEKAAGLGQGEVWPQKLTLVTISRGSVERQLLVTDGVSLEQVPEDILLDMSGQTRMPVLPLPSRLSSGSVESIRKMVWLEARRRSWAIASSLDGHQTFRNDACRMAHKTAALILPMPD